MYINIGTTLRVTEGPWNNETFKVININWGFSQLTDDTFMTFICEWTHTKEQFSHSQVHMVENLQSGKIIKLECGIAE